MATTRIKDLSKTATTVASDANIVIDGSSNGTQKITRDNFRQDTADAFVAAPSTYKLAPLNGVNKIDGTYLPTSGDTPKGEWNASTNSPTLADGTGTAGDYYDVTTAGTANLGSGAITYTVGDVVKYNGATWFKIDSVANILDGISTVDPAKVALQIPNVGTAVNEVPLNGMLNSGAWLDFDAFYETGTWTPRISWLNGNTGLAQSNEGLYTRVGNIVSVRGRVALSDKGSDTGIAYLNDLPFTARNGAGNTDILIVGSASSFSGLTGSLSLTISKNTTTAVFRQMSSTGVAYVTDSSFSNTSLFVFSGTYQIA